MRAQDALVVGSVSAGYGRIPVLRGINLRVAQGEILGILGHNGMGKSTLLKAIMGLIPVTGGSITLAGEEVTRLPPHRRAHRGMGYVPQGRGIFPKLSVRENLRIAYQGYGEAHEGEAVARALRDFPSIERLVDRAGGSLSGGEQQLLALARCLVGDPWLLLLDEPTEGLAPIIVEALLEAVTAIGREGVATMIVEQHARKILTITDRAIILDRGRIVHEADSATLLAHPAAMEAHLGVIARDAAAPGGMP